MKRISNISNNCIPTSSNCVDWNGGDLPYLGICDGDSLNNVIIEIIDKLEELAGDNLSEFDIDALLGICQQSAPLEINIISILTLLKNNQICLKDYINTLSDRIDELSTQGGVTVNLKCYADFDNLGNSLSISREQLDQLVIDKLCNHDGRIVSLEGKVVNLQSQINDINITPIIDELSFATCVNPSIKTTSQQVIAVANDHCLLKGATGTVANISQALASTPTFFTTLEYQSLPGWILAPVTWADHYSNLLLAFGHVTADVKYMKENCCAVDCDSVLIDFITDLDEDGTHLLITFNQISGTKLPAGFIDSGSTVTLTDDKGVTITLALAITNDYNIEVPLLGLDRSGNIDINVNTKTTNGSITCSKCLNKSISIDSGCCVLTNTVNQDVTIVYEVTIN